MHNRVLTAFQPISVFSRGDKNRDPYLILKVVRENLWQGCYKGCARGLGRQLWRQVNCLKWIVKFFLDDHLKGSSENQEWDRPCDINGVQ